jgi:hypothetical protein
MERLMKGAKLSLETDGFRAENGIHNFPTIRQY